MEKHEALLILNLETWPPADVLEELIEDEIFQLRDYFLRNPVIPALYKSRIRKLEKLKEIQSTFLDSQETATTEELELRPQVNELADLLRFLESGLASQRRKLSATLNPVQLVIHIKNMLRIQEVYEKEFVAHCNAKNIQPAAEDIKAADQLNTGLALKFIRSEDESSLRKLVEKELKRIKGSKQ